MTAPLSLKGRAIALLAQREQSVLELRRKLLRHALAPAEREAPRRSARIGRGAERADGDRGVCAGQCAESPVLDGVDANASGKSDVIDEGDVAERGAALIEARARIDEVIAWLQANDYLNERRFVESRVHARASRYGNQRIRQELSQHGVGLSSDDAAALKGSELERATVVWQRKFADPAADAAGRAKQARFLIGRGFSSDVVRRVVLGKRE